jgi:hypothetical protein
VISFGECPCIHCLRGHQLDGGQAALGYPAPVIFAGFGPGQLFLFPRVKRKLAGCENPLSSRLCNEQCEKCVRIGRGYVEKN